MKFLRSVGRCLDECLERALSSGRGGPDELLRREKIRMQVLVTVWTLPLTVVLALVLALVGASATLIVPVALALVFEVLVLVQLRQGRCGLVNSPALFLGIGLAHSSTGALLAWRGLQETLYGGFLPYLVVVLLATALFASLRVFVAVGAMELLAYGLHPLLLRGDAALEFSIRHRDIFLQSLPALLLSLILLVALMRMNDRALRRIQEELERNLALNDGLEETVRRRTEQLEKAREEADASNLAKSALLANMSHEVRTPMHDVLGMADLMLEDDLLPHQRERLNLVTESGNHLMEVLSDILEYTRISDGQIELQREAVPLRGFLEALLGSLSRMAQAKGLSLALWTEPGLPELVEVDGLRLRQILVNLLGYAVKRTVRGEVRLVADLKDGQLALLVQDTGDDLPPSVWRRTGEGRARMADFDVQAQGGIGLGLGIARLLTERMEGRFLVDSEPGKGATFTVLLPLQPGNAEDVAREPDSEPDRDLAGARILLVDDNPANRKVAEGILSKSGCRVACAEHGRMALSLLERHAFDLVLMDCQMPVMDGFEATRILRSRDRDPLMARRLASGIPVVALTANPGEAVRGECLRAGMDAVLPKPCRADVLRETAKAWVGRRHAVAGEPEERPARLV